MDDSSALLARSLASQGFDICHSFRTEWYNDLITLEGLVELGQLKGLPVSSSQAFLIGNTKSIWPLFCEWLLVQQQQHSDNIGNDERKDKSRLVEDGPSENDGKAVTWEAAALNRVVNMKDPFDTFCEERLTHVLADFFLNNDNNTATSTSKCNNLPRRPQNYEIFWAHGGRESRCGGNTGTTAGNSMHPNEKQQEANNETAQSFLVSMQRVAQISGLCWFDDEGSKMCVHPLYGTWKAFRAVVVVLEDEKTTSSILRVPPPPTPLPCPVPLEELETAKQQMQAAIQQSAADGTGKDCGPGKMSETGKSLCKLLHHSVCDGSDWSLVSPSMRAWMELRDCISLGRDGFKYSDPQLLYHYTKDPGILRNEMLKRGCLESSSQS